MTDIKSIDPRTGETREVVAAETTRGEMDTICGQALSAFRFMRQQDRSWRARLLREIANALEAERGALVEVADAETALGPTRLNGELTRTCFQLQMFADVVQEGSYVEATIDHAGDTAMGPRPDLRRMLVPLGPVAVFGASNFPFAFSVPGGDTASALAVGCPVVAKAHESHPATSSLSAAVMARAAESFGAPEGAIAVVYGRDPGGWLVKHSAITAVGFTGSANAAQALIRLIDERTEPIPFYGELGSMNPLVVTAAAAAERPEHIGRGLAGSMTLGAGQFCTKPGLAFVPRGAAGDSIVAAAGKAVGETPGAVLLNANILSSFGHGVDELMTLRSVREVAVGQPPESGTHGVAARLLEVDVEELSGRMLEECFGPVTIVVRYDDAEKLLDVLSALPSSLTGTLHVGSVEGELDARIVEVLEGRAGRVIFNGFPTGVAVAWAQNHGGGWPATNSLHTSVGATAVRRFLRPLAWQDAPQLVLPLELREAYRGVSRRVDGVLQPQEG